MTVLVLAAALALQTGPPPPPRQDTVRLPPRADTVTPGRRPPRDTLRFPARRDSAAAPAPVFVPGAPAPVPADTAAYDSPETRDLVERVVRAGSVVPAGLDDYTADMRASVLLSLRADSAQGGELPVSIDEFAGEVRWARGGELRQAVRGYRVRLLAPTPYSLGSMLESPWVIPHLYGNQITVFQLAATPGGRAAVARATHPFSARGPLLYRYEADDTVRVRTREGTTRLVPITVRPRPEALAGGDRDRLVAGTFWIDVDRAAIARARFGFVERGGGLIVLSETGSYFELENGLVEGRYWLPYRQRREIQVSSPLLGGAAAVRLVTTLRGFRLNTGWVPEQPGARLVREPAPAGTDPFEGWAGTVGADAEGLDIADFADLREAVRPPPAGGPIRVALRYDRGDHFFRFNRVEGLYLGAAARVEPRDPDRRDWSVYGTAGWAFAEGTARGELAARWHPAPDPSATAAWSAQVAAYRRLRDAQPFRPAYQWDLGLTLSALTGYDVRDYYDAAGAEAFALRRAGPWTLRLGGRYERHDSVSINTDGVIGEAQDFPPLAAVRPGDHAAVEAELRYTRGSGSWGLSSSSVVASLTADAGFGDFRTARGIGFVSLRRGSRYLGLTARVDGGVASGEVPPQLLFRFGGDQGLRGFERNEFGGSAAALGRARGLLFLPPYGNRPLYRAGLFLVPPLRPALVVSGDAAWSDVSDRSAAQLQRLGARVTDGWRTSYGVGISIFDDALSAEYVWPGDGGEGKWYVGFVRLF